MSGNRDIIQSNIRKQLALQSGQLQGTNAGGAWQWANSSGAPISGTNDYGNYALSRSPARYVTGLSAQTYDLAKGMFGGPDVPNELIEVLANLATYYANQTGLPVTSLFKEGVLMNDFLASINKIRNPTSQLGYVGINPEPAWVKNPTLGPTIAAVLS
jgi:hypothetical protein